MPHLVLEHSDNLPGPFDHEALFADLHDRLAATGQFKLAQIKSRAVACPRSFVAEGRPERVFVHLTVSILSGRDEVFRQELSASCLAVLRAGFGRAWEERPCDLTVEIREMERASYAKAMNDGAAAGGGTKGSAG